MTKKNAPERIEYLLPREATLVERVQRLFLDHLKAYGYQMVMPPLADNIDVLLDGGDDDLGELTLRLTDPLGGKPIGIRADITPQVRRIDASYFANQAKVNRLCYCGPVLYSRPTKPWLNREQLQAGAELFGGDPTQAALEIILLAHEAFSKLGINDLFVALGHAGISNALLSSLPTDLARKVRKHLAKRDIASIQSLGDELGTSLDAITQLTSVHGDASVLKNLEIPGDKKDAINSCLTQLNQVSETLTQAGIEHSFDLASLSGYGYHTGITFVTLAQETLLCRGGSFGTKERQATGFSLDLRNLPALMPPPPADKTFASLRHFGDPTWHEQVNKLQEDGYCCTLLDDWQEIPPGCDKRLVNKDGNWQLESD